MDLKKNHEYFILMENTSGNTNYTDIARKFLEKFPETDCSLRTMRRKVSDFLRSPNPSETVSSNKFTKPGLHVVLGCVHAPWHNQVLMDGFIELLSDLKEQIVGFHIIGDFLDLNSLSSHERGKKPLPGVTLEYEYEESSALLDDIEEVLPEGIKKSYLYGNHEDRYLRHMSISDNSKYGASLISPEEGLSLEERGYRIFTNWKEDYVILGEHLELTHGQYHNIHVAKKHLDTFRGSIMFAHTHRVQTHLEGTAGAFNIGFMGNIKAPVFNYASRAIKEKWANGFALVQIDEDGYFYVTQIQCFNDRFYYNGKNYC